MTRRTLLALLALLLVSVTALADAAGAQAFVKSHQDQIIELLKQPKSATRDAAVGAKFDQILDYGDLVARAQPPGLTAEESQTFACLLKALVRNAYRNNLEGTLDWNMAYTGTDSLPEGRFLVKTVASHKTDTREPTVAIDYEVHYVGGKPGVRDIITEGSSLVLAYKDQFGRIVKEHGFAELVTRMRKKLGEDAAQCGG